MTRIIILLSVALAACGSPLPPEAWEPLFKACAQHGGKPYIAQNGNAFVCAGEN